MERLEGGKMVISADGTICTDIELNAECDPDNDWLLDFFIHQGERRRTRILGHYVCINCKNTMILKRTQKNTLCPVCENTIKRAMTVDEFEANRMKQVDPTIYYEGYNEEEQFLLNTLRNIYKKFLMRKESY